MKPKQYQFNALILTLSHVSPRPAILEMRQVWNDEGRPIVSLSLCATADSSVLLGM